MFDFNIYTPSKVIGHFQVKNVQLPGALGYLGIGANHAPLISKMRPGVLSFETEQSQKFRYYVSGGIMQVGKNVVEVLLESAESPDTLDKARAQKAEARALDRLKHLTPSVNIPRALSALERARQRIMMVEQSSDRSAHH